MKALGAEIIEFYNNGWPEGWYHDDNAIDVEDNDEDKEVVQPDQKYDLDQLGVLVSEESGETIPFETAFKRWKKTRDFDVVMVNVPKGKAEEFRQEMKTRGYKVS